MNNVNDVLEHRNDYLNSPYFEKHEYGDFTAFYITIAICTILGTILFILNIVFGCCGRYTQYWNDRHTGNRWIVSLWTATPHKQQPLDYKELELLEIPRQTYDIPEDLYDPSQYQSPHLLYPYQQPHAQYQLPQAHSPTPPTTYIELQKRESDI